MCDVACASVGRVVQALDDALDISVKLILSIPRADLMVRAVVVARGLLESPAARVLASEAT